MADPLTAARALKALRDEGLTVHEVRSWSKHNRNTKGPWGPLNGVMIHHTVTKGVEGSVDLCYDGRSDLPGPLCHGVIDKAGEVHLVGWGRANHAGLGDADVLRAVIAETALPGDNQANADGNSRFYGFECINMGDGKDPWPEEQLDAAARAAAALCRAHGWTERSVIGHKEWQPGKVDPRGFTMDSMRRRVATLLKGAPGAGAGSGSGSGTGSGSGGGSGAPRPPAPGKPPAEPPRPPRPPEPVYEPFPGAAFFHKGQSHPMITVMGHRLNAEGCGRYSTGPSPDWTEADRLSYAAWQKKLRFKGKDADGIPGKVSWDLLKVPRTRR
ncbi:peptidoglycan-binding protein [Streptomyces sp. TS71-3]|uniref:peptidoglycan-binding protein n=1 Tax=Streptomyces sp. TS71-3 TaxID=2733862 RepID=UPI001B181746|nr:peptidoglycan-binding protein [Streptomyces sp. TS71-3]GHJ35068.1 hypothetical protein Sm713_06770 [Streptomyces sp. TS71-3]